MQFQISGHFNLLELESLNEAKLYSPSCSCFAKRPLLAKTSISRPKPETQNCPYLYVQNTTTGKELRRVPRSNYLCDMRSWKLWYRRVMVGRFDHNFVTPKPRQAAHIIHRPLPRRLQITRVHRHGWILIHNHTNAPVGRIRLVTIPNCESLVPIHKLKSGAKRTRTRVTLLLPLALRYLQIRRALPTFV